MFAESTSILTNQELTNILRWEDLLEFHHDLLDKGKLDLLAVQLLTHDILLSMV